MMRTQSISSSNTLRVRVSLLPSIPRIISTHTRKANSFLVECGLTWRVRLVRYIILCTHPRFTSQKYIRLRILGVAMNNGYRSTEITDKLAPKRSICFDSSQCPSFNRKSQLCKHQYGNIINVWSDWITQKRWLWTRPQDGNAHLKSQENPIYPTKKPASLSRL